MRNAVVAAAMAALSPLAPAQLPPALPTTTRSEGPVDPQILANNDVVELTRRLTRPTPPAGPDLALVQQQREEAARRLLSRSTKKTIAELLKVLQDPAAGRDAKLAVAHAVADEQHPDPSFAGALLPLLGGERVLSDASARALARYSEDPVIRAKMLASVQDPKLAAILRIGIIRAMGAGVNRDVANTLLSLAFDAKQGLAVQNAAMDALTEMTGQTANGHNIEKWKQWQTANAPKADAVWHDDVLAMRAARSAQEDRAQGDMVVELSQILDEQYEQGNFATKTAILMRELNSLDPRVRKMGVQKLMSEQSSAKQIPANAPKRLEEMVGDSDPAVRLQVAQAIKASNDINDLDAILTQLAQENVVEVKVALLDALLNMKRVRALPALRQMLHDPSLAAASVAVRAVAEMSDVLVKQNANLAKQVADELWQIGGERASEPGGEEFQAACIEASGTLHQRVLAKNFLGLLTPNTPDRLRIAALRALASLGDRDTSFGISQWLANEPSAPVRRYAIMALGSTSSFEFAANTLYQYTSPNTETDASVREQAWRQFESLLPKAANSQVLADWADKFKADPARRLEVLVALNDLLQRDMKWDDLAYSRQNTGETYMDTRINEPGRAALQFELALNYWQDQRTPPPVTAQLVQQLLQALLAAKDYDKATAFSAKQITRNPPAQTTIGPALKDAVNRLHDDGLRDNDSQKLKDGVKLADAILKMQPPLVERFQSVVKQFEQEMQDRLKTPKK